RLASALGVSLGLPFLGGALLSSRLLHELRSTLSTPPLLRADSLGGRAGPSLFGRSIGTRRSRVIGSNGFVLGFGSTCVGCGFFFRSLFSFVSHESQCLVR